MPANRILQEKEKAEWREKMYGQYKQELSTNPSFKPYIEKYSANSIAEFIGSYAREKVFWSDWGPGNKKQLERRETEWINDAFDRLAEIQQKKLFNLQCLWRAEKVTLDGIRLCEDFKYWEYHVLNCPCLTPVTEDEMQLYMDYLNTENFEDKLGWFRNWQDYETLKESSKDIDHVIPVPEWYEFYDSRMGTGVYMSFPDIRGEKEDYYLILWNKDFHRKIAEKKKNNPPVENPDTDKRPRLDYHADGWLKWFIETFDDKTTQQKYRDYNSLFDGNDFDEWLHDDIRFLSDAGEITSINSSHDWREAIHRAASQYRRRKIAEALPAAYAQYRMQLDTNIPFPDDDPQRGKEHLDDIEKYILIGRELNGEPKDFNF